MKLRPFLTIFLAAQFFWFECSAAMMKKSTVYENMALALQDLNYKPQKSLDLKKLDEGLKSIPELYPNYHQLLKVFQKFNFPKVELLSFVKDGMLYPRIALKNDRQQLFIDFYGEDEKFMKIGDAIIAKSDLYNPDVFFYKVYKGNVRIQKHYTRELLSTKLAMTPEQFSVLSPEDRVMYFINLRLVHEAAMKVNDARGKARSKKTALLEKIFLEPLFAQAGDNSCIVAGYVSSYKDGKCDEELASEAKNYSCPSGNFPCNPKFYGFNGGTTPYCVSKQKSEFDHASARCGSQSPLGSPEEIKKFVKSLIQIRGKNLGEFFNGNEFLQTAASRKNFEDLQNGFNSDIDSAMTACQDKDGKIHYDKYQGEACEALNQRKQRFNIAIQEVIAKCKEEAPAAPTIPVGVIPVCPSGATCPPPAEVTAPVAENGPGTRPDTPRPEAESQGSSWFDGIGSFFGKAWKWVADHAWGLLIGAAALVGLWYVTKVDKPKANQLNYIAPAPPPNPWPSTTNNPIVTACCLINNVWVSDSNGCTSRTGVTSVNYTSASCSTLSTSSTSTVTSGISTTTKPTKAIVPEQVKPTIQKKPGRK